MLWLFFYYKLLNKLFINLSDFKKNVLCHKSLKIKNSNNAGIKYFPIFVKYGVNGQRI